jgi:4-diphosphocytidyl-2C-methyl-D-erythritol kinase
VTGAGPAVYGLFEQRAEAEAAADAISAGAEIWLGEPAW